MMAAVITTIADALVAVLDAAALTPDPAVSRLYLPKWENITTEDLTLFVTTNGLSITDQTRAGDAFVYTLNVAVWSPVSDHEGEPVDDMMDFTQQVLDVIRANKQVGGAVLTNVDNGATYVPDMLANNVFVSVIKAEYTLLR